MLESVDNDMKFDRYKMWLPENQEHTSYRSEIKYWYHPQNQNGSPESFKFSIHKNFQRLF